MLVAAVQNLLLQLLLLYYVLLIVQRVVLDLGLIFFWLLRGDNRLVEQLLASLAVDLARELLLL